MHLVQTLRASSLDVRLLWASVFLRMAGFGLTNQVLTLFLKSLAVLETRIGIFMTLGWRHRHLVRLDVVR